MKFQNTECLTAYAHFKRKMNGSHDPPSYIGTSAVPESAIGWDCAISFLLYSISKSQSLTPVIFMTKEYSDISLCMGGKIRL